jgi:predicted RNase H-like HicB family nuclease
MPATDKPKPKKGVIARRSKGATVKSAQTTPEGAMAAHVTDAAGKIHGVGIWDLQVLLMQDGKFWVAQGLQIDYVTQGDSIEEAKKNFEYGLEATIDLNLRMYGNIEGLLMFAPNEVLKQAARKRDSIERYSQETIHQLEAKSLQALPFDRISYLVSRAAV